MWTYSPQKRQVGSALALTYILLLRSCKLMGAFIIHPCLPFVGVLASSRASSLHGHYPLHCYYWPFRHPLVFHRFPGDASYTVFLLRRFLVGTGRASPVALCILVIVLSLSPRQSVPPHQSACVGPYCLRSTTASSASGAWLFGVTCAFTFVTAQ